MPLRPKNSNALDILKSLELDENTNILVIEETETKTRVPIEFEIPAKLLPYLHDYLMHVRACINSGSKSTALWMSKAGGPLSKKRYSRCVSKAFCSKVWFPPYAP
jgi:site-specific recombinase XerD